ncbi:hypothetical protein C0Q70_13371 [Pomacea canaliculata]|uniref:Uncharacterized protein n=1 Tax=Pomacea canaliculata TaxID=400727 RepID=A0A2T7NX10_POMCA|nr:hypothetical protein C0Q70_13371 [Pomacea canaliculata]
MITITLTKESHVKRHLSCGILIGLNLTFLALLSRIWARCRSLSEAYQKWYQDLYPVLFVLTPTNVRWLPEGQELPCDLEAWQKSHGFTPALQESSLEVLIDDWAVLLKKYESVHGDDIEEQMTDISEIDRLPDLDLGYLDEDVGESVSLNEAATTWSAGRDEQFIKNKSEKKKKMKEAKKEKKEKQRLSQKGFVRGSSQGQFQKSKKSSEEICERKRGMKMNVLSGQQLLQW